MKPSAVSVVSSVVLASILALAATARADEGMWTFDNFPKDRVQKKYGWSPTQDWLDHTRLSSLKFGGGCSSSFVSEGGLVMTNHHCAQRCIEQVSNAKRDLMKNGFLAKTPAEELKCPALELRQLVGIEDVTARLAAATKGLADQKFNEAHKAEMSKIEKDCSTGGQECNVVTLYAGGRYHLYKYKKYSDVRLVFAPEFGIAFFGGDPDNFMFPRWDLDVTFLRAYDGDKPVKAEHFFRWSPAGARENDLVIVTGHPGSTQRLHTVAQLEYLRDVSLPGFLKRSAELRGILTEFSRRGPEQKRIAQTLLFGLENSFKASNGQHEALLGKTFFEQKAKAEAELRAKINKDPKKKKLYGASWDVVAKAQADLKKIGKPLAFAERGSGFQSSLFGIARTLVRAADERPKPNGDRLREFRDSALASLQNGLFSPAPIYKELEELTLTFSLTKMRESLGADDPFVKKVLGKQSPDGLANALVSGTKLDDVALRRKLWEGGKVAIEASTDPMIKMALAIDADGRALRKRFEDEIEAPEKKHRELIAKAIFEVQGTSSYPDATGTLRLSYGAVKGYEENGRAIAPFTTIAGAFERHTGRDPFALPQRWLDTKGKLALDTPMNFVSTNDIIGGNSGSPAINKDGEVIGLVFDGNIQSLGGAYYFDESMNRTVMVSSAALIESLRTVYGADNVVRELLPQARASGAAAPRPAAP